MTNLFDYIQWRGDLHFRSAPFNEVDNLLCSMLAYLDLSGIVLPEPAAVVPLGEVAQQYAQAHENERKNRMGMLVPSQIPQLLAEAALCARYQNVGLSAYANHIDDKEEKQFSAVTFHLGDGTRYVAYRGTDDTLVGWKENFNMSFSAFVPAQRDALEYLVKTAAACRDKLRIGGHSKGGNLAVFSAMSCGPRIQKRILEVYNNDGPGFRQSVLNQKNYENIRGRIRTLLPQSSLVGMLMEHEEEYEIVRSGSIGLLQHDGFTWEVMGNQFINMDTVSGGGRYMDRTLNGWVEQLDEEQRREFTQAVFDLLESSRAKTLTDLTANKLKTVTAMIGALKKQDKQTRDNLSRMFGLLIKQAAHVARTPE